MTDTRNIVLTGFMGTGKSTVGVVLAEQLGRVYFDLDTAIQHRTGLTIPQIFKTYGEPTFRAIEKGIAHELITRQNLVIATGGGALIDDATRMTMQQHCLVICLTADPAELATRLGAGQGRPLAPQWRELLAQRLPKYQSIPHQVDTTHKSPQQIAEEIVILWRNR